MAKKVTFTEKAEKERLSILEYYFEVTGNKTIPAKIYKQFNRVINNIQIFPESGRKLKNNNRGIIKSHYKIVYKIEEESMIILHICDTRQNPKSLPL